MTKDSPFIGADGEPKLVDCAVLYFDLLGVSAMAQAPGAAKELARFNRTIRDAFPYPIGAAAAAADGDGDGGAYPATVFSDSVVAAIPIVDELLPAMAVFQLALDVAQLQEELATLDYFARGAITLDKFHTFDGLLFGPALVEAVALERTMATDPRIVLSPAATATLLQASASGAGRDFYDEAPILVDEDGAPFVDYLAGAFQADPAMDFPDRLRSHQQVVDRQLERQATDFPRWSKYRWVAEYHNATCRTYREPLQDHGGLSAFTVPIHTERRFEKLRAS